MTTERTRLAITSLELLCIFASLLKNDYEHVQELFLSQVLKVCERTNKILYEKGKSTLITILSSCPGPLKLVIMRLSEAFSSQNKNLRQSIIESLGPILKNAREGSLNDHLDAISRILKSGLQDAAETVRATSRSMFTQFNLIFPIKGEEYEIK